MPGYASNRFGPTLFGMDDESGDPVDIVSEPGGSVRNWAAIDAGFDPEIGCAWTLEIPIWEPSVVLDQKINVDNEECELTVWSKAGSKTWRGILNGVDIEEISRPEGLPDDMPYEYPFIITKLSDDRTKYRLLNIKTSATTMFSTITGIQYKDEIYAND
jgi:hypothetical protein